MIIFLADVHNTFYKQIRNSVPLGMGYVAAYLNKCFANQIEIYQFCTFEEIYEALKTKTPHLVAFGSYSWNTLLTLKTAQYIRDNFPDTIIAVGGPDVAPNFEVTAVDVRANPPCVDHR